MTAVEPKALRRPVLDRDALSLPSNPARAALSSASSRVVAFLPSCLGRPIFPLPARGKLGVPGCCPPPALPARHGARLGIWTFRAGTSRFWVPRAGAGAGRCRERREMSGTVGGRWSAAGLRSEVPVIWPRNRKPAVDGDPGRVRASRRRGAGRGAAENRPAGQGGPRRRRAEKTSGREDVGPEAVPSLVRPRVGADTRHRRVTGPNSHPVPPPLDRRASTGHRPHLEPPFLPSREPELQCISGRPDPSLQFFPIAAVRRTPSQIRTGAMGRVMTRYDIALHPPVEPWLRGPASFDSGRAEDMGWRRSHAVTASSHLYHANMREDHMERGVIRVDLIPNTLAQD
ncbi:hypothetical protein JHW43_008689 [Diplocarpon mali]|nr:hypothetical protein JHW43_008689 [Diplocarpon mali]